MLESWRRERMVRKVLKGLAHQHVTVVAQPGPLWVIERALQRNKDTEAVLATCMMRGWVEPLHENMPTGQLTSDGRIPDGPMFTSMETIYRLTEGG
jgi:hypothetical protein